MIKRGLGGTQFQFLSKESLKWLVFAVFICGWTLNLNSISILQAVADCCKSIQRFRVTCFIAGQIVNRRLKATWCHFLRFNRLSSFWIGGLDHSQLILQNFPPGNQKFGEFVYLPRRGIQSRLSLPFYIFFLTQKRF